MQFDDGPGNSAEISDDRVEAVELFRDQGEGRLCSHAFVRPHRTDRDKLKVRPIMNPLVVVAPAVVTLLVLAGCIRVSFSVEILGVIGTTSAQQQQE